ncbi:DUF4031 domain-containing protein [Dermatophilus congolensis]|uniref:DUF4031 domain-containing protein n=3 Tax=Dermatophilus congolensis TaxID=1863 RepID=UPI001AAE66B5|nr:DUF4031 domain-containing protein [Dermatophilus congolensis]MBO3152837.1 DUF4031 domain-containing protein [Dermatophilus congolensis]MBO3160153.1 DUF4031 domain-containing protein [Dermatophilus congolensis]MBO3164122.1 DUF4031 domain-containing protein [Dermatophilus congolensis]MBO3177668.1 DUF4031 domain-containing protein [Dermatophilus congolensis]
MILVDWPQWPAHGFLWAHLISDTSVDELHAFARANALSPRAFDLDHYDVAAESIEGLIAAGARRVSSKELLRALVDSGLRVPAHRRDVERFRYRQRDLWQRWAVLGDVVPVLSRSLDWRARWSSLGEQVLQWWSEPHRHYHDLDHLHDVLQCLQLLGDLGVVISDACVAAAWFHDVVYEASPGEDERASAAVAVDSLRRLSVKSSFVDEVRRLILLTAESTAVAVDDPGAALLDADLAVLAGSPVRYQKYVQGVRREYGVIPDEVFCSGRAALLERFLEQEWIYRTDAGRQRWERWARVNVAREVAELSVQ